MSSERKNTGLRVALASYDVHQLRVWHQYIAEQSAEILCSEYRSGEELLQSLKQGRNTEVVVLGGPLEDMDSREFLERMSRPAAKAAAPAAGQCPAGKNRCVQPLAGWPLLPHPPEQPERAAGKFADGGWAGVWNAGAALWPDVSGVGHHPAGQQL